MAYYVIFVPVNTKLSLSLDALQYSLQILLIWLGIFVTLFNQSDLIRHQGPQDGATTSLVYVQISDRTNIPHA